MKPSPNAAAGRRQAVPTHLILKSLPERIRRRVVQNEPLRKYTTLRVGGPADLYYAAGTAEDLAEVLAVVQQEGVPWFLLGGGSNICVSDRGFRGLVIHNLCRRCRVAEVTYVDTGYPLMRLFLDSARESLSGLEFAVGIPGTVGGALVSNAGAYRHNIGELVQELEVVEAGDRRTVDPSWMGFSYRNSRLRQGSQQAAVIAVKLRLTRAPRTAILAEARRNQARRIWRQPWYASAGSFFKNVIDPELAQKIPGLPGPLREAGVIPAGYLSEACGCMGLAVGGAQVSTRHANFLLNRGNATAADIRSLAELVKARVYEAFGVRLEEEVLYVGDWDEPTSRPS
ncbi:MAG: UDP-N-acetylmuramate dehydrogenase [Chthonomonadales bacterium]